MKNKIFSLAVIMLLVLTVPLALAADDLQVPEDVEGLVAYPGDGEVTLEWDMTTDNVGVTGYKIYYGLDSVQEDGGSYTYDPIEVDDDLSYTVEDLENDVTYYFAMTALDEAGNESDYYSDEASATPTASTVEDTDAPYILSATATNNMLVEVVFSEDVVLPSEAVDAFDIVSLETDEELEVVDAYLSDEDESTVLLVTGEQEEGVSYMLTAGTEITDAADNAIVSGTTDTAVFDGGTEAESVADEDDEEDEEEDEEETDEVDEDSPEINEVEATGLTEVVVTFDEDVVLPEDTTDVFVITLSDDDSVLEVVSVTQDEEDLAVVTLETAEMESGEDYILVVTGVTDVAGNELSNTFDRTASFDAQVLDIADEIAPEDVTDFLSSLSEDADDEVELAWTASENSEGDLADQLLYTDDGDGESLGMRATSHTVTGLEAGQTYTFKLTTMDESGNESEGVFTTITLPETGAGIGVVLLATALGTGYFRRKRNIDS